MPPVRVGPEPCLEHARYRRMQQVRRYPGGEPGPPGLVPSPALPMTPVDDEAVDITYWIPGCEEAAAPDTAPVAPGGG